MKINNFKKFISTRKYLSFLVLISVILVSSAVILSIIAFQHQMSLPVYLQSLDTPQISVAELASGKLKTVVLIDVRSPEEYQEDHIGDSKIIPIIDIENEIGIQQIQLILQRYEKMHQAKPTIILYCTSGMRSIKANRLLRDRGYQSMTLTGGIMAWRKQFTRSQDLQIFQGN